MRSGHRILVVVPARGGSKGVPLKNLHPLGGKPLLVHTAELIQRLDWVDRAVVSTDHLLIRDTAIQAGLDALRAKGLVWKSWRGAYALEDSGLRDWLNSLPKGSATR